MREFFLGLMLLSCAASGCLEVPVNPCEDDACFPLNSDALNQLLASADAFNVLALADEHDRLRVETTSITEIQDQRAEISWSVAKDDIANLRSVALRYTIGTASIDTEVVEGKTLTNVRIGNVWFEGRDAIPEYEDPFYDIAQQASENPEGLWPPFSFDTTEIANMDWTITGDILSLQQVATGANATHTIIIELGGTPPIITGIEMYDGDSSQFTLRITVGDAAALSLQSDLPRTAVHFVPNVEPSVDGEIRIWSGGVPNEMSEAHPSELAFHARLGNASTGESLASMTFDEGFTNLTLDDGTWWEFEWIDYMTDELVSAGDWWRVRTNSTVDAAPAVFDIWADAWTDASL